MSIARNLTTIRDTIDTIAIRCGRAPASVSLVAVSKRFPVEVILEAYRAGQRCFGENYVQEAAAKKTDVDGIVDLHLIGHLQSNKVKEAAEIFSMIQTIDRLKVARTLNRYLREKGKKLDVLMQVNIAGDTNKSGVSPDQAIPLAEQLHQFDHLCFKGLMTIPPYSQEPEDGRIHFSGLRKLADTINHRGLFAAADRVELSMGMSHDYHIAIEEGATIVRVGSAIFGQRPQNLR
ncbi:MAG: YggS family pyridoxal phosphate-dependent enzyme [Desulfofustis sp. PB-SRB1]|nr:YggS family pyridoxal phosphate-dependent enzyme [Desulfofustis sp. PB-SRB1]MBM1001098.1 YggS family pyridoxal phosphate-dependent enzyme [Desulfofustis sp. PB-SRB1]HBH29306.1 YggS family pyridoxal phosphate-dependent enzyme [Desulfofustis sp.]HBH32384.1 YggS family pyridoxal phosphate-dependent enzyme [Desulfofustis sp.]